MAVGNIAYCDLAGASEIRDVVREDSDLTLEMSTDLVAKRSNRNDDNKDCDQIATLLLAHLNDSSSSDQVILLVCMC